MSASTSGIEVRSGSRVLRDAVELLSSMRFSISLLTLICIASVIGTVVRQNEPYNNYVNQFGPFWAEVFARLGLVAVYSAPWFLLILAFLVISTSLCIARNVPKIAADLRNFKENVREQSLAAFPHKGSGTIAASRDEALARVATALGAGGWKARVQQRDGGTMVAARKGASNKIGYLAAHSSIVLICLGGLADGDLVVRAQMALFGKEVYGGGGLMAEVPDKHRLSASNPTFRGNLYVPEGARAGVAVLNMPSGVVLQDLPFDVELQRFVVEYYATGMPKLFASEIVIHDRETGERREARVEVNKPAVHRGIAIYQSSFDDGGSAVTLRGLPLAPGVPPFEVTGTIGGKRELVASTTGGRAETSTLEFAALRVINVENMGEGSAAAGTSGADPRRVDLAAPAVSNPFHAIDARLGAGDKVVSKRELKNIGPSITYKIRDAAGQAREFQNYMVPVDMDGTSTFLVGTRSEISEPFRYLRIPADDGGRIDGWLKLRQALDDPKLREQAAERYVAAATPDGRPEMREQLLVTTRRVLGLFAGAEARRPADGAAPASSPGGLTALADFIETVPEADRTRIAEVLLRILNGSLFDLYNLTRELEGLKPLPPGPEAERFMTAAVMSLSDSFFYPAPVIFQLTDFKQVQASVFQVARAPGRNVVYLGCVLLIVGVFMMLYVRDRRLWVWIAPDPAAPDDASRTRLVMALSTTRKTLDGDAEFDRLRATLIPSSSAPR